MHLHNNRICWQHSSARRQGSSRTAKWRASSAVRWPTELQRDGSRSWIYNKSSRWPALRPTRHLRANMLSYNSASLGGQMIINYAGFNITQRGWWYHTQVINLSRAHTESNRINNHYKSLQRARFWAGGKTEESLHRERPRSSFTLEPHSFRNRNWENLSKNWIKLCRINPIHENVLCGC